MNRIIRIVTSTKALISEITVIMIMGIIMIQNECWKHSFCIIIVQLKTVIII